MTLHLTFDDGPSEWTPLILDLLAEHEMKATFFVIGQNIPGRETILERTVAEGHTVGNHTFTHRRLSTLHDWEIEAEFTGCNREVENVLGFASSFWRAPFYDADGKTLVMARHCGLVGPQMTADIVPEDCFTDDPDQIALRVIAGIPFVDGRPAVVSLHDGIPPDGGSSSCTQSRQPTVDAVRLILKAIA